MSEEQSKSKWRHPSEVMKLHQLKKKKKALQARINCPEKPQHSNSLTLVTGTDCAKRKNPFLTSGNSKRTKSEIHDTIEESSDHTLFKLLHFTNGKTDNGKENITDFKNILKKLQVPDEIPEVKVTGEKWIPMDWALKTKVRFLSTKPFVWNSKIKISEEASGVTSFARCLDTSSSASSLDTSPNARFHQCCLYWQQPNLPWLNLFPRKNNRSSTVGFASTANIRESLHLAFTDSFRSLFQLIRTKQCPYFYACTNTFYVLFRGAGICGHSDIHALVTPTTRGFRNLLRQEEIEFTMPLKKRISDQGYETISCADDENDEPVDDWLESMGVNSEEIRRINHVQDKVTRQTESEVDNSEQSLILIEGPEVQAFHSFLINCKSITPPTGPYAGIPPTLLAPVAFTGASLKALTVRETKAHHDTEDYYSLDLSGPILPHIIHNLCAIHPREFSMTATFSNLEQTAPFSKLSCKQAENSELSGAVFREENLSDCGLMPHILRHFCSDDPKHISNVECIKYTAETNSYAWS